MEFNQIDENVKKAILKMAEKLHADAHPGEEFHLSITEDKGLSQAVEKSVAPLGKGIEYKTPKEGGQAPSDAEKKATYGDTTYFAPIQVHCDHCAWASGAGDIIKEFMEHNEQYADAQPDHSSYDASSGYDSSAVQDIPTYDASGAASYSTSYL